MAKDYLYPGSILSFPREVLKRLMKEDSGDAALLYLALLGEESEKLSWSVARRDGAFAQLVKLGLVDEKSKDQKEKELPPAPIPVPDYGEADVRLALEGGRDFAALVEDMQRIAGRILSPADLKSLMVLYDFLALPSGVILTLASWCMEKNEEKYGKGRRLTMAFMKKIGFQWHKQGIDTLEKVDNYLLERRHIENSANRMLPILDIQGRKAVSEELRYLESWAAMGFEDEAIRYAYELTVMKTQKLSWPYMNSVLKSWHSKNFHTKQAVLDGETKARPQWQAGLQKKEPTEKDTKRQMEDLSRLDRLLMDMNKKEGEG